MKEIKNIKVRSDMYYDTKFKIIDTKPLRDTIHYVWMRLLTLAAIVNKNGELYLSENIPYSIETLALEFNRDAEVVKMSLDVLVELEMIILNEHNVYIVKNFMKHQKIKSKKSDAAEVKCEESENEIETKEECLEENNILCDIKLTNNNELDKKNQPENETKVKEIKSEERKFVFNANANEEKKTQERKGNNRGRRKTQEINMFEEEKINDKYIFKISDEPDIREDDRIIGNWSFS